MCCLMAPIANEIKIRRATAEDASSIASVLQQAFDEYVALYTPEAYAATTPASNEVAARMGEGPVWIALHRDQVVGTISGLLWPDGIYVRSMAVINSARGLGIGHRLLEEIEHFAKAHRYARLFLSTTPFLNRAIRLYEAFGFRRTNAGPHDLFGTPLFTMEKAFSAFVGDESPRSLSLTPAIPTWAEIHAARQFLKRHFAATRLIPAPSLARGANAEVCLKLESEMPTGSFKVRGALYALQAEMTKRQFTEVVAASTGNHGAAVAYAGRIAGIKAKIFLPRGANPVKQSRIRELGAEIVAFGNDISEALARADRYARETGAFLLNDATNPNVPAGTATIGVEVIEQFPGVTGIWVPIGDTALIRGIASAAKHLRPDIRIISVQAERAPAYYLSWKRGTAISTETCDTIADGLATRIPVEENVIAIRELVDDVRLVTEDQMLDAIAHLLAKESIRAEPAGAATTAAWVADSTAEPSAQTVLLVSGSNISEPVLRQALKRANIDNPQIAESFRRE
jgi:threonine dehydratase